MSAVTSSSGFYVTTRSADGWWLLACVGLTGCPSLAVHQTADPLPKDDWAVGASAVAGTLRDIEQDTKAPTAQLAIAARRGVARDVDIGVNVHTFGADANVKWRWLRHGNWSFATLPSVGGARLRETAVTAESVNVFAQLPVLATVHTTYPITVGAKTIYGLYVPKGGGHEDGWSLGAFANVDVAMGRRWHLVPELGAIRTIAGTVPLKGYIVWLGPGVWKEW